MLHATTEAEFAEHAAAVVPRLPADGARACGLPRAALGVLDHDAGAIRLRERLGRVTTRGGDVGGRMSLDVAGASGGGGG